MQIYACWVCILLTAIWKIETNTHTHTHPSFMSFQQLWLSYSINQNPFCSNNLNALKENIHLEFRQERSMLRSIGWTFTVPLYPSTENAAPKQLDTDRNCWSFENHRKPSMPLMTLPSSSFKLLNKILKNKLKKSFLYQCLFASLNKRCTHGKWGIMPVGILFALTDWNPVTPKSGWVIGMRDSSQN